jgi:putative acetyltransferase
MSKVNPVLDFVVVRPDSSIAQELISELDNDLLERYPGQWIHGLHPEDINDPEFFFAVAYFGEIPVGCGALRPLAEGIAEVKRMFVLREYRRRGFSRDILSFLESRARATGYMTLRLETGTQQPESTALYASAGYRPIPCYGEYIGNPFSLCFEKQL